ncbi:LysE family transporter [uncultured Pseudodesulfovibrio sp.]|uniref:LysE family translocator n=1 Tax=uncultured Pseudodesulfovibrio sp. TaxID=2035858 RepID=UPI0029C79901|nr:LysE family transporter [uncultured Pseudodesulfovibrio sp.]
MNLEIFVAFVLFAIVMTGTPGVGNLTMMGIGQTTGFRSALPFLGGTVVGMFALNVFVGLGLGGLFLASSSIAWSMKIGGMGYICYLGWKLLTMQIAAGTVHKRFTFLEGVVLHPLNPKSWAMSVVGFSQLADPSISLWVQMGVFVVTFMALQTLFHSTWGLAGSAIMCTLKSRRMLVGINCILVVVMVGATAYALFLSPA